MSWVKLDDNAPDDPRALKLPRGVRLLHMEALAWASRHMTGGVIPQGSLARLTDEPDPDAAAAELVAAGLWELTKDGWQLLWLQDDQPGPELVAKWRERNRRKQDRHRRHVAGDHSACSPRYCKAASRNPVSNGGSNPYPSSPVRPSTKDRMDRDGDAAARGAAAVRSGSGDPAPPGSTLENLVAGGLDPTLASAFAARRKAAVPATTWCRDYRGHQGHHHQLPDGSWMCGECQPAIGAA